MSYSYKFERSLFEFEEFQPVHATHHPYIYDHSSEELTEVRSRLRDMRDKERTLARERSRSHRGKADDGGKQNTASIERPRERKQVLGSALQRVGKELKRRQKLEARARNVEAAQNALELRRKAQFKSIPKNTKKPAKDITPLPSRRRHWTVPGARIGSISQMTKNAQAARDTK